MSRYPFPPPNNYPPPGYHEQHYQHAIYPEAPSFSAPPLYFNYNAANTTMPSLLPASSSSQSLRTPNTKIHNDIKVSHEKNSQCNEDQVWVDNLLQNRAFQDQCILSNAGNEQLKIRDARVLLTEATHYLKELRLLQDKLKSSVDCDPLEWQALVLTVNEVKEKLEIVTKKIDSSAFIQKLKSLLLKRIARRKSQKLCKNQRQKEKQEAKAVSQAKHLQIDAWLAEEKEILNKIKREEDTKREADVVLGEVRLKQSEGCRYIQLFESLKRLRQLRAQAAADKGLRPAQNEDDRFAKVLEKLQAMWESQLKSYNAEERTLKVMLEEEAVARHIEQKPTEKTDTLVQWEHLLFGHLKNPNNKEYVHHNVANTDLLQFIQTRHDWDVFVAVPGAVIASALPVGWVIPAPPSSDDWHELLNAQV